MFVSLQFYNLTVVQICSLTRKFVVDDGVSVTVAVVFGLCCYHAGP